MRIRFCSAPCGAGKTHRLVDRACGLADDWERVLVVQPTKELIDKTVEALRERDSSLQHHVFHSGTCGRSVSRAITQHFKEADEGGQVVFITHAALPHVIFWANQKDWHVLMDVELPVVRHFSRQLPHTHFIVTEHIRLDAYNAVYGKVVVDDREELREKARNPDNDELWGHLAELTRVLINPHWECYANVEQFEKLKRGTANWLSVHAVLKPSVIQEFGSAFLASANFENSIQYRLWSESGVTFQADADFSSKLLFRNHPKGSLIDIHYAPERPWSGKLRDAEAGEEDVSRLALYDEHQDN